MKAAILNYTGNHANYGCQATSQELLSILRSLPGVASDVELEGAIFSRCQEISGLEGIDERLREILVSPTPSQSEIEFLLDCCSKLFLDRFDELVKNDIFFFQAEGTMGGTAFHKGTGLLLLPFVLKNVFNKTVFAINGTIFSAHASFDRIVENVFNQFDVVAVRELASYRFAKSIGIHNCLLWPDAAFLARPAAPDLDRLILGRIPGEYFCVAGSGCFPELDAEETAQVVAEIAKATRLMPICILSTKSDQLLFQSIRKVFPRSRRVIQQASYAEVAGLLGQAQFLIGGRYHIGILSSVASTPFLSLPANTFKMEGLHELLEWNFPVRKSQLGEFYSDAISLLENREELKSNLEHRVSEIQKIIRLGRDFFAEVTQQLSDNRADDPLPLLFTDDRFKTLTPELAENQHTLAYLDFYRDFNSELDRKKFGYEHPAT